MSEIETLAKGLTEAQRAIVLALCGNAWTGKTPTPGINCANSLEMMHIDVLKDNNGEIVHFKARPTPLGLRVRDYLKGQS